MQTQKQTITNSTLPWSVNKRYKVNDVVTQGGNVYQNKTGANSEPSLLIDWTFIGGSTSTPTLQEVTDAGAETTTQLTVGGLRTLGNVITPGITFISGDDYEELAVLGVEAGFSPMQMRSFILPNLDGHLTVRKIINSNENAVNNGDYSVVSNATFTDPTPVEGKGYMVTVINGTATIGGVGYTVGQKVFRHFHSGSWRTFVYNDDLENNYIPLSGTTTGNEVTGIVDFKDVNGDVTVRINQGDGDEGAKLIIQGNTNEGLGNYTNWGLNFILGSSDNGSTQYQFGLTSDLGISNIVDVSANIGDLDYTQKIYVDNQKGKLVSLTETEILDIASPETGRLYYNTTQNHVVFYDGSVWKKLTHSNM
jgi:hypothetical protein